MNKETFGREIRHIAIEGVIGVGKTTLAMKLAKELKGRTILEDVEGNPFLKKFYSDPKAYAFSTQIFFLLSRYRQQQELSQMDIFGEVVVADYLFEKDKIFAYLNLNENEIGLYEKIIEMIEKNVRKPDLVVYLQSHTLLLMKRIKERGRSYEMNLSQQYLENLNEAYNHFFFHYTDTPLLVVNVGNIDFVNNDADFQDLLRVVKESFPGTKYYVPATHQIIK